MRKTILYVFSALCMQQTIAQYSQLEGQIQANGQYLISEFASYPIRDWFGIFVYVSKEKGYVNIAPGVYVNKKITDSSRVYWETGIGYGTTLSKKELEEPNYKYIHYYFWFETKPNEQMAKKKFYMQINPAYTFGTYDTWQDNWWTQSYCIYSVTRNLGVGVHYQSQSAKGLRVDYNVGLGRGHMFRFYVIAGNGYGGGMSYNFQKQ